jgi:hypothetical protein
VTGGAEPTLSVVIVTWNSRRVITDCLTSIEEDLAGTAPELIVVDNASTDGTADLVASAHPSAQLIRNRRNLGLAAGNNQGLQASSSSEILICNPDVTFRPGAIPGMRAVLQRHRQAGWVVPRLVATDGTALTSAGDLPTLVDALLGRQAARYRKRGATSGFWWDDWDHDEEREIGRGHEAAYLVRRRAVDEVGLHGLVRSVPAGRVADLVGSAVRSRTHRRGQRAAGAVALDRLAPPGDVPLLS